MTTSDPVLSSNDLAAAVGIGASTLSLVRKAGKILGDPIPNYATAQDVHAWLRRWPMFLARDWEGERWRERQEKYTGSNQRAPRGGKSGARE